MEECYICNFCRKLCKNGNSLRNHERLYKENPERQESSWVKFNHERGAWNKGLTKETDERLLKAGKTLSDGYKSGRLINANLGKQHTDEEKKNLSEKRKQFLMKNPDKVPYLLNHHSKGDSYPEKYFKEVFDNEKIEYKQNYYQIGYFLDFAWPDKKICIEVDGKQHLYDEKQIERDKTKDQLLLENNWKELRIPWIECFRNPKNWIEIVREFLKGV